LSGVDYLEVTHAKHIAQGAPAKIALGAALSAFGCLALLGIGQGTSYWAICAQLIVIGGGLLVPPLTSTLLGSVEKSRSGIAAGVLNATRQTGSVLGVALFGSPASQADTLQAGAHASLAISAGCCWWAVRRSGGSRRPSQQ
jgi:MFS transporter, DHA2 family, methylenomycin A resistance protein